VAGRRRGWGGGGEGQGTEVELSVGESRSDFGGLRVAAQGCGGVLGYQRVLRIISSSWTDGIVRRAVLLPCHVAIKHTRWGGGRQGGTHLCGKREALRGSQAAAKTAGD
jgi:hypothetical protein